MTCGHRLWYGCGGGGKDVMTLYSTWWLPMMMMMRRLLFSRYFPRHLPEMESLSLVISLLCITAAAATDSNDNDVMLSLWDFTWFIWCTWSHCQVAADAQIRSVDLGCYHLHYYCRCYFHLTAFYPREPGSADSPSGAPYSNLPLFNLLRGRFWGFSPCRGDTLHRFGWNLARRSSPPCQISPQSVQQLGYRSPKTEIFTEIWSKCGILTPRRGVSVAQFSYNLQSLYPVSGCISC